MKIISQSRPRLYFAAPVATYGLARYDRALAVVQHHFADHEVLSARALYPNTAAWLCTWPRLLPTLHRLAFISGPLGVIGAGVWREVHEAAAAGLPVHFVTRPAYALVPLDAVILTLIDGGTLTRYARVQVPRRGFPALRAARRCADGGL